MADIEIKNRRVIVDTTIKGANVTLTGAATLSEQNELLTANGDIRQQTSDSDIYVGNYSLYGININEAQFTKYRTEASQLLDELVAAYSVKS